MPYNFNKLIKSRVPIKIYTKDIDSKAIDRKGENYEKSQKHSRKTCHYAQRRCS